MLPLLLPRINNVPGAIQALQHASVLGRRFTLGQLSRMMYPVALRMPLFEALERADIVYADKRGASGDYAFKHIPIA